MSDSADSVRDVERKIGIATGIARSLTTVWKSRNIQASTKVRLYRAQVQSLLLYNSETWTMTQLLNHKLLVFEMTILRFIAGVTRRDRRGNVDIRKELVINHKVVELVRQKRMRYFGHVVRIMPFRTQNLLL